MFQIPAASSRPPHRPGPRLSRRAFLTGAAVAAATAAAGGPAAGAWGASPRVFFGLDVPDNLGPSVDAVAHLVGAQPSVVSLFLKLDSTVPTDRLRQMAAAHQTAFVTLEPWLLASRSGQVDQPDFSLASIIRGDHDADFTRLGRQLGALRRPFYLRFAHEMNAWWYPWAEAVNGNRPGQYVAAWRHVHRLISSVTSTPISWVWSPNVIFDSRRRLTSLPELFPGDDVVTDLGMTGYSHDDRSPAQTFGQTVARLESLSRLPVVLSEIGAEGGSQSAWIGQLSSYLESHPRIRGFVYFNTSPATTGATGHYEFSSTPASVAAFRRTLRSLDLG